MNFAKAPPFCKSGMRLCFFEASAEVFEPTEQMGAEQLENPGNGDED